MPGVPLHASIGGNRAERADIVVAEVPAVVVGFGERDGLLRQDVTQGAEMQRLGVGDDAVEIENDGADHQAFSLMRSPARIGDLQLIFTRRERTYPLRVEVAVRVVGPVEIELVDAGRGAIEVEIAAGRVGFVAAREIAERHEETIDGACRRRGKRGQRHRLTLQRELQRADAPHRIFSARRSRHHDRRLVVGWLQRRRHVEGRVHGVIHERQELGLRGSRKPASPMTSGKTCPFPPGRRRFASRNPSRPAAWDCTPSWRRDRSAASRAGRAGRAGRASDAWQSRSILLAMPCPRLSCAAASRLLTAPAPLLPCCPAHARRDIRRARRSRPRAAAARRRC